MFKGTGTRKNRELSINRMIPNFMTMMALSAGLTAMLFGLQGKFENACYAILVAAVLDGLDGRIARLLKGTSKFGAELDSLSDFVSFGVAPAMLLYFWTMNGAGKIGWALVLLFAVCCALRLARFNTDLEAPQLPSWAYDYFTGVPSPAGAGLVLFPMYMSFQFGEEFFSKPAVVGLFMAVVSFLLVSRVPTYSFKRMKIKPNHMLTTMVIAGIVGVMTITMPWTTLSIIMSAYMFSILLSIRSFTKLKKEHGPDEPLLELPDPLEQESEDENRA